MELQPSFYGTSPQVRTYQAALQRDAYLFIHGAAVDASVLPEGDIGLLRSAFNDLVLDQYLPTIGRYRRHARYVVCPDTGAVDLQPHGFYSQSAAHNHLVGGIDRRFESVPSEVATSALMTNLIRSNVSVIGPPTDASCWDVNLHLVRITATFQRHGLPAPEGVHADGFDYVSMHLFDRTNVGGADTSVMTQSGEVLKTWTMSAPFDSLIINDDALLHYSSPVTPVAHGAAVRDMVLLSYDPAK